MAYEICKRCGKMFEKDGKEYCKDCFEKNRTECRLVKEYIRKYPNAIVLDIIAETGVSFRSINSLVEEGSITYVESQLTPEDVDKGFRLQGFQEQKLRLVFSEDEDSET